MHTLALWIGWAVIVASAVVGAVALVTYAPYVILNACWHRLKMQEEFIRIAMRYFDEKKSKGDRRIMGTPE